MADGMAASDESDMEDDDPRQQTHEWLATIQIDTYVYTDTTL